MLEASFPHKSPTSGRFFCTLKVADFSSAVPCTLVLMANSFEELPIVQRVGDLIRVHRATVADYLGAKQLTARVYFNSSWTLFGLEGAPRHEFVPFRYLGKSYSEVTKAEQRALRELRRWAAKHLKETYQGGKKVVTLKELGTYHE